MLTHDEATFYTLELSKRLERLRVALAERGLPDWLETVAYDGRIFRDWHPCRLGARRYAVAAHAVWDEGSGFFRFRPSVARFVSHPGKGFRTFREAREMAAWINERLDRRFPMVDEVKVAMLKREQGAVHDARQREIAAAA